MYFLQIKIVHKANVQRESIQLIAISDVFLPHNVLLTRKSNNREALGDKHQRINNTMNAGLKIN